MRSVLSLVSVPLLLLPIMAATAAQPGPDAGLPVFTADSLARFDGADGRPAYVGVQGLVYDVTAVRSWKGGRHEEHLAGRDLTRQIADSPHGMAAIGKYPVVGRLAPAAVAVSLDTGAIARLMREHELLLDRRMRIMKTHRQLALTTAGLLLVADGLGMYHFIDMIGRGHHYRDSIGFDDDNGIESQRTAGVKSVWYQPGSQAMRTIHGASIALASIGYTATATMELTMPRIGVQPSIGRQAHRGLFYAHAACMAANIGLGFLETWALSQGRHRIMGPIGEAHTIIGLAAPVLIITSGIVYGKPH